MPPRRHQVELWDCSGDKKYENCWPAILRDAHGVIMVYDPTVKSQEKDIELWHKAFVQGMNLPDSQVRTPPRASFPARSPMRRMRPHAPAHPPRLLAAQVLLMAHSPAATPGGMDQAPLSLARFTYLRTSLDHEDLTAAMKQQFDVFLGKVAVGMAEKSRADMEAQMAETGR